MAQIEIGRLLRAGTTGFIAGCRVNQLEAPAFGTLVSAPLTGGYEVYGLIYDIGIEDDGLVRQLVTADNVSAEVFRDNRERRIVPVELSVLSGWLPAGWQDLSPAATPPASEPGSHLLVRGPGPGQVHVGGQVWIFPAYPARH